MLLDFNLSRYILKKNIKLFHFRHENNIVPMSLISTFENSLITIFFLTNENKLHCVPQQFDRKIKKNSGKLKNAGSPPRWRRRKQCSTSFFRLQTFCSKVNSEDNKCEQTPSIVLSGKLRKNKLYYNSWNASLAGNVLFIVSTLLK